jgi:sodium/bile acid cotransporter 7
MKPGQFIAGIFGALVLAFILPGPGAPGGWLHPHLTGPVATFLIFLIQGLQLKQGALAEVARAWKLHLACQAANFILAPAIFLILTLLSGPFLKDPSLRLGMLFLGMLPTTINSAITMVHLSGGRVASAIFNSSLSNLLGILIVPVWVNAWMRAMESLSLDLRPVFLKLLGLIFLPVIVGRGLQPVLRRGGRLPSGDILKLGSMWLIFLIVYLSFCRSVTGRVWELVPGTVLGGVVIIVVTGLILVHWLVWLGGRGLGFERPELAVFLFCGAQKTIAAGVPLGTALLLQGDHGIDTGLFLIPLMIYHPLQMLIGGRWIGLLNNAGNGED